MAWVALLQGRVLFHCPVPALRALPSQFPYFHQRHRKFSSPLGTTKCLCAPHMLCGNTFRRNALDSVLAGNPESPSFFHAGDHSCVEPHRHDIMRQTDARNRQPSMTVFHLSHHFKGLSLYLSFGLLQLNYLKWSSEHEWLNTRGLCLKHFRHVWIEWSALPL